ncbi:penicillin acylase family protein [Thalassobacillus sp. CUG 92003]|uniref:penicillin acylase family protein n=1 Tax=Thalassobacillus sp. CUG 92003 TaxID=2736641 RepID=UPI0015E66128|nr:penicillin acylase family protein [Thalassobacillus sp. CUG 92003]
MEAEQREQHPVQKKHSRKRILIITLATVLILIAGILLFINSYINRTLPETDGTLTLNGLDANVTVTRDEDGVPHINAKSSHDLFMAQGYVQAQDRLFQMELSRRQASGRLSEVIGEATVSQDKYFRTLGLRRAAEKSLAAYSDETMSSLDAYAAGVNAYIDEATSAHKLPPEFLLMGIEPEPWSAVDSLTIGKYMAFDLGGHWERQAFNYYLINELPEDKAMELFPGYPEAAPKILDDHNVVDVADNFKEAIVPNAFNGSNNWVVSGDKTASGKPILADDPHLGMATPSIWYQMHLQSPEYDVSGVIFAGIPGIILGHNQDIAWGVTNVGPDVQQLYLEKRHPEQPELFLYDGEWEEAEVIQEPIKVKDAETIDYEVMETRHGPLISEFAEQSGEDTLMSLRWTALDASTELESIMEINKASNWQEFEKSLEKFLVPAQNFVFASQNGTIAYKANGLIPVYENPEDALLPLEGWHSENDWDGFIPFDELPTIVNPEQGYIATANNKIDNEAYPYHISHSWAQPYRYQRITDMIEEKGQLNVEDMKAMQTDVKNLQAEEMVPRLLPLLNEPDSEQKRQAIQLLNAWDFFDSVDKPQPLLFQMWFKHIEDILYGEAIPKDMRDLYHGSGQTTDELIRKSVQGDSSIWFEEAGGFEYVINQAFDQSLEKLTDEFGHDLNEWQWGDWHQVEFTHPFSSISFLDRFYNSENPMAVGGSRVTVRAAGYNDTTGLVNHGASWRFILDGDDFTQAEHVVGPGQSGHFRSEWYHDQMSDWVKGDYHTTKTTAYEGEVLTLSPGDEDKE